SRFTLTRWHLGRGYAAAIRRSPLGASERVRCYAVLARYFLQVSKWKGVVKGFVTGRGNGGAYLSWVTGRRPLEPTLPQSEPLASVEGPWSPRGGASHEILEQSSRR